MKIELLLGNHFRFFILVFCLTISWTTSGQFQEKFERITSESGDFQSIVYCIDQDSLGNIWAGTEEGVVRFNSRETFLYNKYKGLPDNFSNRISTIFIDSKHRIWIGSSNGLALYNPLKDKFDLIPVDPELKPNLIEVIAEDGVNNIWIGAFNGLWKYSPDEAESFPLQVVKSLTIRDIYFNKNDLLVGSSEGLQLLDFENEMLNPITFNEAPPGFEVRCIYKSGLEYLIGTQNNGLFKCDAQFQKLTKITIPSFEQRNFPIHKIIPDRNGKIYVATDGGGLIYLDRDYSFLKSLVNDVNNPNSISSNGVYDMILGEENIFWIATYGGGLNILDISKSYFQNINHVPNDENSIIHSFTRSILQAKNGEIWFGTKEGISIWNRNKNQWKNIAALKENSTTSDIVMALAEDGNYVWAATYGNGVFKINKSNLTTQQFSSTPGAQQTIGLSKIYTILIDSKKNCWLGGIDGALHQITSEGLVNTFPIQQVRQIIETQNGNILAVGRNGVQKIRNGTIEDFEDLKSGQNGLEYNTISCIYEDKNQNLTVGTNGAGLIFYNPQSKKIKTLNRSNGLPSDLVQGVLYDEFGNLWASTSRGLASISLSPNDTTFKVFDKTDGLVSTEFNYGSYVKLSDQTLMFGGIDGLVYFDPGEIKNQDYLPRIIFEELDLFNKKEESNATHLLTDINSIDEVTLKYFENSFSLKFIGILHSTPEKVKYSWNMDGVNEGWSTPNTENRITFSNLSPGDYTFGVKAANRDGVWGAERQLQIKITPPWWASNIAYLIYGLLAIGAIIGVVYLTGVFVNKRNAEEQIAFFSNITHELKTPLTILLSTLDAAPKESNNQDSNKKIRSTVSRLNTLFDQLLNFNKVTSGNFQKSQIEKIHLGNHIDQVVNGFKPLMDKKNISFELSNKWKQEVFYYDQEVFNKVLFNLVSNAIKYSKEDGSIKISLLEGRSDDLKLSIEDTGIGIPKDQQKLILKRYYRGRNAINSQTPGTGLGLMIVKNLVEQDNGSINFESVENQGTTFTIILKNQSKLYQQSAVLEKQIKDDVLVHESSRISDFSDAKILVVEDNDELRQLMVSKLGTYFQVYEADNGKNGLEKVAEVFPDLIITDFIMPEMDGMEMCRALQKDINLNHIPVFMMTVLNNTQTKIESIESGIAAYMEKPIDFNFLLAKMTSTLDRQKMLRERFLHQTEIENAEKFRNKRDADFINNLEKFVLQKIKEEGLSVHDLCREVGMSRTALYMKLKNMVDLSPQNFIIHTRLKYARKLLTEGDINVKEVAYEAGFSNPKYFSTSFKKLFGESPTSYMKSLEA